MSPVNGLIIPNFRGSGGLFGADGLSWGRVELAELSTDRSSSTGGAGDLAYCLVVSVWLNIVESMFDSLVAAADGTCGAGAVGAWARVENAACARRLASTADMLEARRAADGSAEREQWCVDNWDAVAAEVAAAQNVSLGVASHQLMVAMALRERLARVAEVFAAGQISYRLVSAIGYRTALITDPDALAKVDTELAAAVAGWGSLSVAKTEQAIDYWVDRYDPNALRRSELGARGRHVEVVADRKGSGLSCIDATLFSHDAAALDQRLDAMARAVCDADPRRGPANTNPAVVIGGAIMPAPLLAAKVATTATMRPLVHPGDAPPQPRYTPSRQLADFVRCRDLTCRFPGCDEPAYHCDLDHTLAYPVGPTCASNLKCLCRKHHLLKTFCGWLDQQSPDGTVIWTTPNGQTYTTHPGSRLLFPTLCRPTAPIAAPTATPEAASGLMMPRRKTTREQDRAKRIDAERRLNDEYVAERNRPPPF